MREELQLRIGHFDDLLHSCQADKALKAFVSADWSMLFLVAASAYRNFSNHRRWSSLHALSRFVSFSISVSPVGR
jgi:hypothetical protein